MCTANVEYGTCPIMNKLLVWNRWPDRNDSLTVLNTVRNTGECSFFVDWPDVTPHGWDITALLLVSSCCYQRWNQVSFFDLLPDLKVFDSVVAVSKCFLSVGFGRFCRKNLGFRFGLGFHDKRVVNFFMTRVIWHVRTINSRIHCQ